MCRPKVKSTDFLSYLKLLIISQIKDKDLTLKIQFSPCSNLKKQQTFKLNGQLR